MTETQTGIPDEVDGEIVCLSPNSAEGKAVQRIGNPIPEDKWITVGTQLSIDIDASDRA